MVNLIILNHLENSPAIAVRDNCCLRILYGILVFFLAVFFILFILAFFFFLGCPYEFVKCYLNRNEKKDDDSDDSINLSNNEVENKENKKDEEEGEKSLNWKDYIIIFLLIVVGIFLQPLYLLFYILMAMMELYRQCGCWIFFAYS